MNVISAEHGSSRSSVIGISRVLMYWSETKKDGMVRGREEGVR